MAKGLRSDSNEVTTRLMAAPATGPAPDSSPPTGLVPLANVSNADDLKAIEALTSTGSLHRTGSNTWALRQSLHTTDTPEFARLGLGAASVSGRQIYSVSEAAGAEEQWVQAQYSTDVFPASIRLRKARGTLASPEAIANNDFIGLVQCRGYDGSAFVGGGSIFFTAAEAWGASAHGCHTEIYTQPTGAGGVQTRHTRFNSQGQLLIGTTATTSLVAGPALKIVATVLDTGAVLRTERDMTLTADSAVSTTAWGHSQTMALAGFTYSGTMRGSQITCRVSGSGTQSSGINANETSAGMTGTAGTLAAAHCFYGTTVVGGVGSTITVARVFVADQTGSGGSLPTSIGYLANSTLVGGTLTAGFAGLVTSGSGKWNCYMSGTAENYFAANILVGTTSSTGLTGAGGARLASTTAATSATAAALVVGGGGAFDKSLWVGGVQTVGAPTNTIGLDGGSILLRTASGAGGNGGAVMFGAGVGSFFAGIKGNYAGGATYPTGDVDVWVRAATATDALARVARFTIAGNVVIGGTAETGLTGAGGLRVFSTTEASAAAGALVVDGGIYAAKIIWSGSQLVAGTRLRVGTADTTYAVEVLGNVRVGAASGAAGSRVIGRGEHTSSPAGTLATGEWELTLYDNGATPVLRLRYNDAGTTKVFDVGPLV